MSKIKAILYVNTKAVSNQQTALEAFCETRMLQLGLTDPMQRWLGCLSSYSERYREGEAREPHQAALPLALICSYHLQQVFNFFTGVAAHTIFVSLAK